MNWGFLKCTLDIFGPDRKRAGSSLLGQPVLYIRNYFLVGPARIVYTYFQHGPEFQPGPEHIHMVENYTKDLKESVYHGAVVSALAVGYTMLGTTLIKIMSLHLSENLMLRMA